MNLHALGIRVPLLPGWEGRSRLVDRGSGDGRLAHLHLCSGALPPDRGDFGSGAVEQLAPDDVFVALLEFDPDEASAPLFAERTRPRRLGPADFSPGRLQRTLRGQAGAQIFFAEAGRALCLYVVLGAADQHRRTVPLVNDILARTEIDHR